MKTNVLEKIYLFENPITETPDDRWLSKRSGDTDVEYTRTDVFIEKACKAYCKMCKMPNCNSSECKFINEFRNYMKGE